MYRPFVLALSLLATTTCSGRHVPEADADADADADGGGDGELDGDAPVVGDADAEPDGDAPGPEDVPDCGDGVVDDGEECDDGNRLNGDSCDWLCRAGPGEPPPAPDPTVPDYVPSGEPVPAGDPLGPGTTQGRLPLSWSGSQFATAYPSMLEGNLHFHRFDGLGRPMDSDWEYVPLTSSDVTVDLVWNEPEYGLFFGAYPEGVYFLRLDVAGKPLGSLTLVAPYDGGLVAADVAGDGYVVACCQRGAEGGSVNALLVDRNGSTDGLPPPLSLPGTTCSAGDVATGLDGFALSLELTDGAAQVVRVGEDLAEVSTAVTLGPGVPGDVLWAGDHYVTAMTWMEDDGYSGTCIARFSPAGLLEAAPVCSVLGLDARLAVGDRGLALAYRSADMEALLFARADAAGVLVGTPHDVPLGGDPPGPFSHLSSLGLTWADDGFAVLFGRANGIHELSRMERASP